MYTLIDGDVLVYSCGFASQKNTYTIDGQNFRKKKDANAYADLKGISRDEIEKTIKADPIEFALGNVKKTVISIAQNLDSHDGDIFLSGPNNFREVMETTHPYKGTRDPLHKPIHYQAIKDYLVKYWEAIEVDGMEADDAMGIAQYTSFISGNYNVDEGYNDPKGEYTVIVTIDKDLDMIPGWHYNWVKGKKYFTTLEESDYFFDKQLLTGDRVDNIIGIYGIGDKKSDKLLDGLDKEGRMKVIIRKYQEEFGIDADDRLEENKKLLWILREEL